jgi:capsular polysaccharide biosynthesis protein
VRVAEAATVPVLPVHSGSWYFLVATMIAIVGSLGLAFIADFLDPTLRTPSEVEAFLDIPVVATMPRKGNGDGKANGDDNANGTTRIHVS